MTSRRAAVLTLAAAHFVCPLLFFTDLTRNPYFTQIALLNILILAAFALRAPAWLGAVEGPRLPRTPLDAPLLAWAAVCALSWTVSYLGHKPFYRDSLRAEGMRVMLFTAVNALLAFWLAADASEPCPEEPTVSPAPWAAVALLWGLAWTAFPQMRSPSGALTRLWPHLWDPYGGLLWGLGLAGALWLARRGGMHELWHVALFTGWLGAAYGICQYFNWEFLWPKALNPYGGRSVSTFGNPNFLSSYVVVLFPLAVAYYLKARTRAERALYAVVLLTYEGSLLSSLTRSSWAGALAGAAVLALSPRLRERAKADPQMSGLVATAAAAMLLFWPQSTLGGYTATVIGRLSEVSQAFRPGEGLPYSPWYQRVLIWACAWQMGAENPLTGKGWGAFELFYPFYQGNILDKIDFFRIMRTHANNAHNELLEVWAQTGILGTGVFLWVWACFFRSARGLWRRSDWMLAAAAGVAGMLVDNLLNVSLHFAVPAFLFWWQAGVVMGHAARSEGWRRAPAWGPAAGRAAALAALALAAAGSWQWVRQWNRETNYFMGFKLMRREQPAQAVEKLEAAYRWHPREVNANYELGNAYARVERFEKAVWGYREALKANAGYDEIYFNLAILLGQKLGRKEEALDAYRMAWAINPLSLPLYVNLSAFYLSDPERWRAECVALLERAAHFFPDEASLLVNLGYLHSLAKEDARAEAAYARALARKPDLDVAERNLRASLARSGNAPPPALAAVDGLRELERRLMSRDFGAATLALARRVAAALPDYPKAVFLRANLELMHGDAKTAAELLRRVTAAEPGNAAAWLNLAHAWGRLGQAQAQAAALRRVLELEPGNAQARSVLQQLGH